MLGGKDPPSAETPHPGGAIPDFSCTSILLSILYTATIHAYLVLHIIGSSDCDHHRVKISCGGNKFFFQPESPAKRLLVAAEQAEVLACIPMPTISRA
jgi:hypothetical protein